MVGKALVPRGLTVMNFWVWPWKRKSVSEGRKYLVTVINPQGVEVYNHSHTHKALFKYVMQKYLDDVNPLDAVDLPIKAFSLATAIESYLASRLQDGLYVVMVPRDKTVATAFWKKAADEITADHEDPRLDCYVVNLDQFHEDIWALIEQGKTRYPGRYLMITVKDGFVLSTDDLS